MTRIGIVGAGAAGLTLAALLARAGTTDVTVFEASDRAGGKTRTAHRPGLVCDMTTCYLTGAYGHSASLFLRYGAVPRRISPARIIDGDGQTRDVRDWLVLQDGERVSRGEVARQGARYRRLWRQAQSGRLRPEALSQPFLDTLRERDLPVVERLVRMAHTGQFYGQLSEVTTEHALRWNTPGLLASVPAVGTFIYPQGFETLWRAMAHNLDVRFGTPVDGIETSGSGADIVTNGETHRFDEVVVATDWGAARQLIWGSDLPLASRELADAFETSDVATCLLEVPDAPDQPDLAVGDRTYVASELAAHRPNRPIAHRYAGSGHMLTGSPDVTSEAEFAEAAVAYLADRGHPDARVVDSEFTPAYNPRLKPDAVHAGTARRIAAAQGERHVWYTGAWCSFESVKSIVGHNQTLARQLASL